MNANPNLAKTRSLGAEAFAFGFPLLAMAELRRRAVENGAPQGAVRPLNRFAHLEPFPNPGFQAVVGADSHTLYSMAWLDLRAEPLVLELPPAGGRSYLVTLLDAWNEVIASLGPRTAGDGGASYAIAGPVWDGALPDGVPRIDSPTGSVWAIAHLHAAVDEQPGAVRAIQRQLRIDALSVATNGGAAARPPVDPQLVPRQGSQRRLMEMDAAAFLAELDRALDAQAAREEDRETLERLAAIGVGAGRRFEWAALSEEVRAELEAGFAESKLAVASPPSVLRGNGWQSLHPDVGAYGADYLRRARIANHALGVPLPQDAIFPFAAADEAGYPFSGEHRYRLCFEPGEQPPARAHWSLALYDLDQLLVPNELDRHSLGSREALERGADGSLEIAIQRERPAGSIANWLPAPEGGFHLMLHMYWPGREALDGSWMPPPVQRVG